MRLLALHFNPQHASRGGHFLMLPLHNNGTKIGMDNDQSCASQLPRVEGFLGCGLALIPSDSSSETLSLRSKTNPSATTRDLGDRHQGTSAVDFSALDGHWLSCSIQGAQDPFSLVIHFVSACEAVRTSK